MRIIRQSELLAAPWKNGGGVTREALRWPVHGEPWAWRLSFAEVAASGPFSDFSGYTRYLVLLQGAGVRLEFGDGTAQTLRTPGEVAQFDGGIPTRGELLAGPCADLNLIVAHPRCRAEVRVITLPGVPEEPAPEGAGVTRLVVPLEGSVRVTDPAGRSVSLAARDAAVGEGLRIEPEGTGRVFVAGIIDNSA